MLLSPIFTYILNCVREQQLRHEITDCNCNLENKENYLKNSEVGYLSNSKINITIFVDYIKSDSYECILHQLS